VSIVSSVTPTILSLSSSDEIIDNFEIPMKLVPAGKFTMGSNIGAKDETPTHEIFLDSFYIDKYEVTNAQYAKCITAGLCQPPKQYNSTTYDDYFTNSKFSNYPVIFVDWYMAKTYCEWRGARLPTEAEWEKAAKGVDERVYPWGSTFDGTFLNSCDETCAHESANSEFNDGYPDVAPVGLFEKGQSPYGIFDMSGNVWEWVGDWYSPMYYGESPLQNPTGPSSGQYRVIRGGGWRDQSHGVSTSVRVYFEPINAYEFLGFRCVKPIGP
jgi:formylglycine-generating enzyme required for sulfatase activity